MKSANLFLKPADLIHNGSQQATFGHSQSDSTPNSCSRQAENRKNVTEGEVPVEISPNR
jgi:hypothetical protein